MAEKIYIKINENNTYYLNFDKKNLLKFTIFFYNL